MESSNYYLRERINQFLIQSPERIKTINLEREYMNFNNFKTLFKKYWIALGIIIILFGLVLRVVSLFYDNTLTKILGELGTVIAVSVAIPFIYEIFLKNTDREIIYEDLSTLFDEKISHYIASHDDPKFYSERRKIDQKIAFYEKATIEIIEVGASLHALSNYYHSIAPSNFENHIISLLKNGVHIKLLLLDPKSEYAINYAKYLKEANLNDDFIKKLELSISNFKELNTRLIALNVHMNFEVYTYKSIPCYNAVFLDKESENGYAYLSSYINNVSGNSTPGFEFSKKQNPNMFKQYQTSMESLFMTSEKII